MNNCKPLISIIIPVYNAASCIGRCIESLLAQSMTDFEIIAVDDGSQDRSLAILEKYAKCDGRIRVLSPGHGGVSAARNHGIDAASGRWLTFVDADDYVGPDYLSDLYDDSEGSQMSICGYSVVNPGKEPEAVEVVSGSLRLDRQGHCPLEDILSGFTAYCLGFVCSKLFKREIVEREGLRFDENISFGEDGIFAFTYFRYVTTVHVSFSSDYFYVVSPDGVSLSAASAAKKRIKGVTRFLESAGTLRALSPEINDKIESHYLDGMLTALMFDYKSGRRSLTPDERYEVYRNIYSLTKPGNHRPVLPLFFDFCGRRDNWKLYERLYRMFYL